jgi:hypothetical protein
MVAIVFSLLLFHTTTEAQNVFTALLRDHVHNGHVNYETMKGDARLNEYIRYLSTANPDTISSWNGQLAFWINAYNAFTLKLICDRYPVESINELHSGGLILGTLLKTTIWDKDIAVIHGATLSLNTIEHEIIRKRFQEPRIHFALVCASKSCPPLRSEAFEGSRLDEQLDDQGRAFLRNDELNFFDLENRTASISKIFRWFEEDFGSTERALLVFLSRFLPEPEAEDIRMHADMWRISYRDYDWNLNK